MLMVCMMWWQLLVLCLLLILVLNQFDISGLRLLVLLKLKNSFCVGIELEEYMYSGRLEVCQFFSIGVIFGQKCVVQLLWWQFLFQISFCSVFSVVCLWFWLIQFCSVLVIRLFWQVLLIFVVIVFSQWWMFGCWLCLVINVGNVLCVQGNSMFLMNEMLLVVFLMLVRMMWVCMDQDVWVGM